jgi:Zn-dependent protease
MSIFSIIKNGSPMEAIIFILARCFVVFICLPIHELSHGLVADKLGDKTARNQGRLSFSPFAHLNPIGTIMIFLFGIGYANPVPVNPRNFKNPKSGMALVALAGPLSNLLMAFISVFLFYGCYAILPATLLRTILCLFFNFSASVNVTLAVFNLFPIPPLDGSKILAAFLPDKVYYKYMMYERYIMIALMIALFAGILDTPIYYVSNFLMDVISFIPKMIFGY